MGTHHSQTPMCRHYYYLETCNPWAIDRNMSTGLLMARDYIKHMQSVRETSTHIRHYSKSRTTLSARFVYEQWNKYGSAMTKAIWATTNRNRLFEYLQIRTDSWSFEGLIATSRKVSSAINEESGSDTAPVLGTHSSFKNVSKKKNKFSPSTLETAIQFSPAFRRGNRINSKKKTNKQTNKQTKN